ncbi:hypothetical protein CDO47_34125, partial [Pseudomonas aeruginosa]|uniref:c-type cytochrome n=1 Tax=Pseudomonas aeruginosa TaxID=287 RepID=UPI000B71A946
EQTMELDPRRQRVMACKVEQASWYGGMRTVAEYLRGDRGTYFKNSCEGREFSVRFDGLGLYRGLSTASLIFQIRAKTATALQTMRAVAGGLEDSDIQALAGYLGSLGP